MTVWNQIRKILATVYAHGYDDCKAGLKLSHVTEKHRKECDVHVEKIVKLLDQQQPMGVSQWKKHGKKYGYWKYFQADMIKQIKELKKKVLRVTKKYISSIHWDRFIKDLKYENY